ncbi:unnamed protein product [Cylicocyclus nassatus]|uniref:Uncharacterized protein n=1 Tax=Cylicocyclus nassatus TaxID=53992 RepID=A0AA36GVU0_CYLNA|nr:unnamed protein product [Cylicocyclus nassatus]
MENLPEIFQAVGVMLGMFVVIMCEDVNVRTQLRGHDPSQFRDTMLMSRGFEGGNSQNVTSYSPPSQRKPSPGELCLGEDHSPADEEELHKFLQNLMGFAGPSETSVDPLPSSSPPAVHTTLKGALDHTYSAYEPSELFEITPEPETLFDCIMENVLHMDKAAKYIRKQKERGTFRRAEYERFTHSKAATGVVGMDFEGLESVEDALEAARLGFTAYELQGDIMRAQFAQFSRKLHAQGRSVPGSTVSLSNCSNLSRRIEAPPPFKQLRLVDAAIDWIPPSGDISRQITSLYRYILEDITDPPQCIQKYAIRINGLGGRDRRLENLPDSVLWTLVDFGTDVLGLGNKELLHPFNDEVRRSSFYLSLGADEEEREGVFLSMRHKASEWRSRVWSLLQRALTEIRAYTYDEREGTWIRTRKRATRPTVVNLDGSEAEIAQ